MFAISIALPFLHLFSCEAIYSTRLSSRLHFTWFNFNVARICINLCTLLWDLALASWPLSRLAQFTGEFERNFKVVENSYWGKVYSGQHVACLLLTATSAMLAHLGHQLMLFANFVQPCLRYLYCSLLSFLYPSDSLQLYLRILCPSYPALVCLIETSFLHVSLCCSRARADTFRFYSARGSRSTICSYILSALLSGALFRLLSPFFRKFFFIA